MKKILTTSALLLTIMLSCEACNATEEKVSMYAADGRTLEVNETEVSMYQAVNWSTEPPITLYDRDGNTTQVLKEHLQYYLTDEWLWFTEPVTLMYAADGRTTYIMNSEVEIYSKVGWSTEPPVVLYKQGTGEELSVLVSEVNDYLALGTYFQTYQEACPARFTYEPFQKSNLSVEQLNQALANTGLQGQGQAFYEMEQKYNVNSLFALAVACHESANGYKKANRNNFFGMRGKGGWMSFKTPYDNIMYFGELMNKPLYKGKSISGIAQKYCSPPGHWITCVKKHMQMKWEKISIGR